MNEVLRISLLWVALTLSVPFVIVGCAWGIVYLGFNFGNSIVKSLYGD